MNSFIGVTGAAKRRVIRFLAEAVEKVTILGKKKEKVDQKSIVPGRQART